jgi:hypothetical protein
MIIRRKGKPPFLFYRTAGSSVLQIGFGDLVRARRRMLSRARKNPKILLFNE